MTVPEAIQIQKDFVAKKYHIFRYSNNRLRKSMKLLTEAYCALWEYLMNEEPETIDRYIKYLIKEDEKEAKDEQRI